MEDRHISYLLKIITDKIRTSADAHLKSHGLTMAQSRVLAFLHSHGGEASQKEIEDFLEVAHPTVVGIVSRMEKNGFVSCFYERVSKIVRLTEKAEIIGEDMVNTISVQNVKLFANLSEAELNDLERMLQVIYHNLK